MRYRESWADRHEGYKIKLFDSFKNKREIGNVDIADVKVRPSREKLSMLYENTEINSIYAISIDKNGETIKIPVYTSNGVEVLEWRERNDLDFLCTTVMLEKVAIRFVEGRLRLFGRETLDGKFILDSLMIGGFPIKDTVEQIMIDSNGGVISESREGWQDRFIARTILNELNKNSFEIEEDMIRLEHMSGVINRINKRYSILEFKVYETSSALKPKKYMNILDTKKNKVVLEYMAYNVEYLNKLGYNGVYLIQGKDGDQRSNQIVAIDDNEIRLLVEDATHIDISKKGEIIIHNGFRRNRFVYDSKKEELVQA